MREKKVVQMTQAALIAAIYVALCLVFAPISYGEVQIRVAEALTILPFFTPVAIPGLFVGCLIANVLGGGIMLDVVFGSLATLLGAVGTYLLRKKSRFLAPLPPILANTLLVPFVLYYGYGVPLPIPFMMVTVGIGEIVGCGVLGMVLLAALSPVSGRLFHLGQAERGENL
ncbi:MAG: QueT transporter family protein [Lachnospiraceae bacterium]|nr:QueT transporter family protein [Lachnospiraceae bacterium]